MDKAINNRILFEIESSLNKKLPGNRAHQRMISYARPSAEVIRALNANPKQSAVLILLYQKNNEFYLPLIRRPEYDGVHSRQIGLPGGQKEKSDKNLIETAVRETNEEIGADKKHIRILGSLTEIYIPPSNFLVQPIVGYYSETTKFKPDLREVSKLLSLSLRDLLNSKITQKKIRIRKDENKTSVSCYIVENEIVWGATSMMLNEFKTLLEENGINQLI